MITGGTGGVAGTSADAGGAAGARQDQRALAPPHGLALFRRQPPRAGHRADADPVGRSGQPECGILQHGETVDDVRCIAGLCRLRRPQMQQAVGVDDARHRRGGGRIDRRSLKMILHRSFSGLDVRDRRSSVGPVSVAARPAPQRLSGGMPKIASRGTATRSGVCRDHDLDVVQIEPFAFEFVVNGVERVRDPGG